MCSPVVSKTEDEKGGIPRWLQIQPKLSRLTTEKIDHKKQEPFHADHSENIKALCSTIISLLCLKNVLSGSYSYG